MVGVSLGEAREPLSAMSFLFRNETKPNKGKGLTFWCAANSSSITSVDDSQSTLGRWMSISQLHLISKAGPHMLMIKGNL